MSSPVRPGGNFLGAARAEVDSGMLTKAFIETPDFRALTQSKDHYCPNVEPPK